MKNSYLIIICLLFLIESSAWGKIVTRKVNFSYSELKIDSIASQDGDIYIKMSYPGTETGDNPGSPSLPVKYVTISLPHVADDISLKIQRSNTTSHFLSRRVFPIQEPEVDRWVDNNEKKFIPCKTSIYDQSVEYPHEQARIVEISSGRQGDKNVVVAVYPVIYHPTENRYDFCEDIDITLSYNIPSPSKKTLARNAQMVDIGIPFYEYCVITSQNIKNAFTRLIAWKREKGLNAGVVCKEDIFNNPYIVGDTVSSIYDEAGKIRQYLQYAYASGVTKYVLFGGNDQLLPIRYGTGYNYNFDSEVNHIPTDFYFSELDSNWNIDNDIYYGESHNNMDYGSELAVGRLLCVNGDEINNYTNKLFWYELNPGKGAFSYLKKALYTQSDQNQMLHYGDSIKATLHDIFPNDTLISESPSYNSPNPDFPTGNDVISVMNNRYGFVSWLCHGHPNAVVMKSSNINGDPHYGIFSVQDSILWLEYESANGLNNLTNKYYPMIAYTKACLTTPFDIYISNGGTSYDKYPNLGQSFTLGKDYGGPAYIGNTRDGIRVPAFYMQKLFNQYMRNYTIGEAQNLSKENYSGSYKHYITLSSNLIGCPELRVWTNIPSRFYATQSYDSDNYVIAANNPIIDAKIGIRDIAHSDETTSVVSFNPSQGSKTLTNVENCLITLTGKDCLPQIMPLTIQNATLQGAHYVIANNVTCGRDVREGTSGDVVFDEDSDYTFETRGIFVLTGGVTIKQGARMLVIPSEIKL